jgi:hypothetical protein
MASAMACQLQVQWQVPWHANSMCHGTPSASAVASAMACQQQVPWHANGMPTAGAMARQVQVQVPSQVQVLLRVLWQANCKSLRRDLNQHLE